GHDARSGGADQEHPDRRGAQPATGQDPLLGPRRGCDQGGDRGLQEEAQHERNGSARSRGPCGRGGSARRVAIMSSPPSTSPSAAATAAPAPAAPAPAPSKRDIEITEAAAAEIAKQRAKRGTPDATIRIGVRGGGCTGFTYVFEWAEQLRPSDKVFSAHGVSVV